MGEIIELKTDFSDLADYARKAMDEGDFVLASINLNEAMEKAESNREKHYVYSLFFECYRRVENGGAMVEILARDLSVSSKAAFEKIPVKMQKKYNDYYEEEAPSYEDYLEYCRVQNLIKERDYRAAAAKLATLRPHLDLTEDVCYALEEAAGCDNSFDLDEFGVYMMNVILNAPFRADFIYMMLKSGRNTRRLALEGAAILLDDEDPVVLKTCGEAYYRSGFTAIAEKFFAKVLSIYETDEECLYYMAAIAKSKEDEGAKNKYLGIYKAAYSVIGAPTEIISRYIESDCLNENFLYGYMSVKFINSVAKSLSQMLKVPEMDTESAKLLADFCKVGYTGAVVKTVNSITKLSSRPEIIEALKEVLRSDWPSVKIKEAVLDKLLTGGYEGEVVVLTENFATYASVTRIHRRVSSQWESVYRKCTEIILLSDMYIPLRCSVLSMLIKRLSDTFEPEERDLSEAVAMCLANYCLKLKVNADIDFFIGSLGVPEELMNMFMKKYALTTLNLV